MRVPLTAELLPLSVLLGDDIVQSCGSHSESRRASDAALISSDIIAA